MRDDDDVIHKLRRMSLRLARAEALLDAKDERVMSFRATRERIDAAIREMQSDWRSARKVSVRITAEMLGLDRAIKELDGAQGGSQPDAFPVG